MANKIGNIVRNGVIYGSGDSSDIAFDPTVKNVLDATTVNVQDAIDELSTKPSGIQSKTKADYDALADKTGSYVVTDDDYPLMANEVSYDNTASGLTATHVQNAIDEVNTKANEVKYSNPNLLDNPWFTVNQRGTTNVSAFGYLVDRWICTGGSVSNNQITIVQDKYLYQRFEKDMIPLGTQLTVSVKFDDDTIRHGNMIYSSTYTNDVDSDVTFELQQATNFGYLGIRAKNSDRTIKSVKMELGNISTIANDIAPNYATELVKCQRYYRVKYYVDVVPRVIGANDITYYVPIDLPYLRSVSTYTSELNAVTLRVNSSTTDISSGFTPTITNVKNEWLSVKLSKTSHGYTISNMPLACFKVALSADL